MIDDIDRQIISLLQDDARLSNAVLAEAVGLTISTVHERVKKLEKKGVITGYVAQVDAEAMGKPITAFIRLTVGAMAGGYVEEKKSLASICRDDPDILECHNVAGEDCYILKVRVGSPKDLEKLLERLRCNTQVLRSVTSIVLSTLKESSKIIPHLDD
jgi:Lrp/AsnC family transcriptional regulator, leucine-responsive regulatory protein